MLVLGFQEGTIQGLAQRQGLVLARVVCLCGLVNAEKVRRGAGQVVFVIAHTGRDIGQELGERLRQVLATSLGSSSGSQNGGILQFGGLVGLQQVH